MMKWITRLPIGIIFLTAVLYACIGEENLHTDEIPDHLNAIEVKVELEGQSIKSTATKAGTASGQPDDPLNENKIEHIKVFIFKADGKLQKGLEAQDFRQIEETATGFKLQILVPKTEVDQYEGKDFQICILANDRTNLSAITHLDALKQVVEETEQLNKGKQDHFLMDGTIDTRVVWGDTETIFTVSEPLKLKRAASKIRLYIERIEVVMDEVGYDISDVPEVKLVNYTSKTSLLQGAPYDIQPNDWKSTAYQPMSMIEEEGVKYWTTELPYYAYENSWREEAERETYLLVKLNLSADNRPAKSYYYRLPVSHRMPLPGETDERLYRLDRNHLYHISSSIEVLGNEDEGEPLKVESSIAIEPWIKPEPVDGSVYNAHYLVVKEKAPQMMNIDTREVGYMSDLEVDVVITKTSYILYDEAAQLVEVVWSKDGRTKTTMTNGAITKTETVSIPFDGAKVVTDDTQEGDKKLIITHRIPTNFVPFEIHFKVTQRLPSTEKDIVLLSEEVVATQYPGKYVTGEVSPGPGGGTNSVAGADFRYHSALGSVLNKQAQVNTIFYKITTLVNDGAELIGDPTDGRGITRRDAASNKLVSPQFIIASQHGMTLHIGQYRYNDNTVGEVPLYTWGESGFAGGTGPYNGPPNNRYYRKSTSQAIYQFFVRAAGPAVDRCYHYFEGEYGMDGWYNEHFLNQSYNKKSEYVYKTFKYKGRWRMPTKAEIEFIDKIQDDPSSAVKFLLMGELYYAAQDGYGYNFYMNSWNTRVSAAPVRCVFDTYKHENHP